MVSKTIKATVGQKIAYKIIKDGFKTVNGTIDVTSDMDTNVSLETPSTPYTSNIDYSIVENDAFPSIFKLNEDVVLPDDSVLEKNDYLLYPKGEYLVTDDSNEMVYENNFIVNGSVKNVGYIFSNFNTSNYLTLNGLFNPGSNVWETVIKINTTNLSSGGNCWLMGSNTSSNRSWLIGLLTTNSPYSRVYLSSNGSSWDIASVVDGSHQYALYTDYWLKFEFTGNQYILSYSTDGQNFIQDIVINSTTPISNNQPIQIGNNETHSAYFPGTVDLSETYIKIDGEIWWKPQVANVSYNYNINGTCALVRDGVAKGFSSSNYVTISQPFKPESHPWEIGFKIRPTDITSMQRLIGQVGGYYATIGGEVQSNGTLGFGLTTTGYDWDIAWFGGRVVLTPNEWHWIRLSFTGSEYKYELSTNGVDYELVDSVTNSTPIRQGDDSVINLGYHGTDSNCPFKGAIDLNECYIKINGKTWWQGISKNKFKKGDFKMIGNPNIDMNGVVSNFSDYNYIQFPHVVNNETEIFTTFTTGSDISTRGNVINFQGGGEIYISNNVLQTWNMETATDMTLTSMLPNTLYSLRMKLNPNGRTITIYDADNTIIVEQTINDSGTTFNNNSIINFGFYNANSTSRYWRGSIDLANTYVIIDGVTYKMMDLDGRYLKGIFDESFVDNYNQEQVVKLYHTMSENNGLTITNDKVNDENVLYSQYINNVTIPPRTTQFTYNIDNESWEIV